MLWLLLSFLLLYIRVDCSSSRWIHVCWPTFLLSGTALLFVFNFMAVAAVATTGFVCDGDWWYRYGSVCVVCVLVCVCCIGIVSQSVVDRLIGWLLSFVRSFDRMVTDSSISAIPSIWPFPFLCYRRDGSSSKKDNALLAASAPMKKAALAGKARSRAGRTPR